MKLAIRRGHDEVAEQAVTWMSGFFDRTCDKSPACDGLEAPWYLPPLYKKKDVFAEYQQWCEADATRVAAVSKGYFGRLWKKHFRHVKIPKKNRFSKCARCDEINTQWWKRCT